MASRLLTISRRLVRTTRDALERVPVGTGRPKNVVIACQGGGSHAAFTAGALGHLLGELPDGYRVAALTGTSGGAVSATAAWYGHLADGTTPEAILDDLWTGVAATEGWDRWVNEFTLLKTRLGSAGSDPSPYRHPGSKWGRDQLEALLAAHVDFDAFADLRAAAPHPPRLLVGAVDVHSGDHVTFTDDAVDATAVVASAAVPMLFRAVEIDGRYHWDGFLSQNPPVSDLFEDDGVRPVDELWVVRLTPREVETVPTDEDGIYDRTQQLVENVSLERQLEFVERKNRWVRSGALAGRYTETAIRELTLYDEQLATSRLNRRESFIEDLMADGEAEAVGFLADLERSGRGNR